MSGQPWIGDVPGATGLPTISVGHDPDLIRPLPPAPMDLRELELTTADGLSATVGAVLDDTATDAWIVLRSGELVAEWYGSDVTAESRRPLMSITKSVVGAVAGVLVERAQLAVDAAVTDYVPELAGSGYQGATVRHLLDMRSGVLFREDYADPAAHIRAMDAAIAGLPGAPPGLQAFLVGLIADRPHGGLFEYRSCEADVLGWVCERASGTPMAELVASLVWSPMGAQADAEFLTDVAGTPVYDGGLLATARDVARFGQLMLDGGLVAGRQVLPLDWVAQLWTVSPELRAAFATSAAGSFLPGGWYHDQWWVLPGPHGDLLLGLGIHGQLLRVDPATRTVMAKLSSWPAAQDPVALHNTLRSCDSVASAASGRSGSGPRFGPGVGRIPPVAGR